MAYPEEYFIHVSGEQKGPYTYPQLKNLYDRNLIPEETLYWRDGMEQLEPVSDICGRRRDRLRMLRRLRLAGIIAIGAVSLLLAWCGPVLKDGWREMNERDRTPESAYWRARGFVREAVKKQDASVAFEPYKSATVSLSGDAASVTLPGTLFARGGAASQAWKVTMQYNTERREWRLPAQ